MRLTNKYDIIEYCEVTLYDCIDYIIKDDLSVDIYPDVWITIKDDMFSKIKINLIEGDVIISNNIPVKSFINFPTVINGALNVRWYDKLSSFEGFPEGVTEFIGLESSKIPLYHLWSLFYNLEYIELFNYYDIVRLSKVEGEKDILVLDRLKAFVEDMKTVSNVKFFDLTKYRMRMLKKYYNII